MPASLHDVEEATAQAFKIIVDEKMLVSDNRGSFIQFLMLLVVHHPSERLVCFFNLQHFFQLVLTAFAPGSETECAVF
jgi:hypothetical protein